MKQMTEAELRELLETAYIKGWDDAVRSEQDSEVCKEGYLVQKQKAIDSIMEEV